MNIYSTKLTGCSVDSSRSNKLRLSAVKKSLSIIEGKRRTLLLATALLSPMIGVTSAYAACSTGVTHCVKLNSDAGNSALVGSFSWAIAQANAAIVPATIGFDNMVFSGDSKILNLSGTTPTLRSSAIITGALSSGGVVTIDGSKRREVLFISPETPNAASPLKAEISYIVLNNGRKPDGNDAGGAIFVGKGVALSTTNVAFTSTITDGYSGNVLGGAILVDSGGALILQGSGTQDGSGIGKILNHGSLTLNYYGIATIANVISGKGTLKQTGDGITTLNGLNSYMGGTEINQGTLQVSSDNNLGDIGGALKFDGGTLKTMTSFATSRETTLGAGGGTFEIDQSAVLTHSGTITGSDSLSKTGNGALVLNNNNTLTGAVTINDGLLQLGDGGTKGDLGGAANTSVLTNNGTLTINRSNDMTLANQITGKGDVKKDGAGKTTFTGNNNYTGSTNINAGTLQLGDGGAVGSIGTGRVINHGILAINHSNSVNMANIITGLGMVKQDGKGTTTLSGANNYIGGTEINNGALQVSADNNLGDASGALTFKGGTLKTSASFTTNRATMLDAGGGTFHSDQPTVLTHSGIISGAGRLTKSGSGALVLNNNNSLTGAVTINAGLLQLGDGGTSGDLGGAANTSVLTNNGTLAINRSNDMTLANQITGVGHVQQIGAGKTIFTGNNDYTGNTNINAGTLQLGDGGAVGSIGTGKIINHSILAINRSDSVNIDNIISGLGMVKQDGNGTTTLNGANNYIGGTEINNGALQVSADNNLGDASGALTFKGGTLKTSASFTTNRATILDAGGGTFHNDQPTALTHSGIISGAGSLTKSGGGALVLTHDNILTGAVTINDGLLQLGDGGTSGDLGGAANTSVLTNNSALAINRSNDMTLANQITGVGHVSQIGSGETKLSGANDYSGSTFVSFGTLAAGTPNSFSPNSSHHIADGATLDLNGYGQTIASLNHAGTIKLSATPSLAEARSPALSFRDFSFTPPSAALGTALTVTGDYSGAGGTIIFNTMLGDDNSPTDRLNIAGNSSGSALVKVNNVGGAGSATVEGIKLIDVAGNSGASFSLVSDYLFEGQPSVIAGAYSYRLYQNGVSTPTDGDWYLRSTITDPETPIAPITPITTPPDVTITPTTPPAVTAVVTPTTPPVVTTVVTPTTTTPMIIAPITTAKHITGPVYQPGAPLYETYAQIMSGYNDGLISRLHDRVGDRYDNNTMINHHAGTHKNTSSLWALMEGSHARISPNKSTTGARYDYNKWRLQIGTDGRLYENAIGKLYGGVMGHFGTASADIKSLYGKGTVNLSAYGLGTSLTWMDQDDFYIDGQAHWSWYKSDIKSHSLGKTVAKNNHGHGYGMSLELGRKIALNHGWEITPQAQLSYSEVRFNKFTDPYGGSAVLNHAQTLRGRLGAELGRSMIWKEHDGTISRSHFYGLANLTYDFRNGSQVALSNVALKTRNDRLWAELGMGGSYRWNNDQYSLSGEASAKSSLNNFAKSYELRAKINFSIAW